MQLLEAARSSKVSFEQFANRIQQSRLDGCFEDQIQEHTEQNNNILHCSQIDTQKFHNVCQALVAHQTLFVTLLNEQNDDGNTPLHQLVISNSINKIVILAQAVHGNAVLVSALLESCNKKNKHEKTAYEVQDKIGQNLIDLAMIDVNAFKLFCDDLVKNELLFERVITLQDLDGDTPIHQLVNFNRIDTLAYLFSVSAEKTGLITALLKACNLQNKQGKAAYEVHDGRLQNILCFAMKELNCFRILCNDLFDKIDLFTKVFADQDDDKDTILHQLVQFERWDALRFLVNRLQRHDPPFLEVVKQTAALKNNKQENFIELLNASDAPPDLLEACQKLFTPIKPQNLLKQAPQGQISQDDESAISVTLGYKHEGAARCKHEQEQAKAAEVARRNEELEQAKAVEAARRKQEQEQAEKVEAARRNEEQEQAEKVEAARRKQELQQAQAAEADQARKRDRAKVNIQTFDKLLGEIKITTDRLSKSKSKAYQNVKNIAEKFYTTLKDTRDNFVNVNSEMTSAEFKTGCLNAICDADAEFKQHRGLWYKHFHPVVRKILGVLATITIVPALIVALARKPGFVGTFFKTPKTKSEQALEQFHDGLSRLIN